MAQAAVAAVEHRPERGLQLDRLRRRARDRAARAADHRGDRAEQPARPAGRLSSARTRHVVVVFPLVPVIPTTGSSAVGSP